MDYVDALSMRQIGERNGMSGHAVSSVLKKELDNLIENTYLSSQYNYGWQGVGVVDGTYVKVRGYDTKIPFIYLVDYATHDIVCGVLAAKESHDAYLKLFRLAKTVKYPLAFVVCDNIIKTIEYPLKYHFPRAMIQLCHKHYLENIRRLLEFDKRKDCSEFYDEIRLLFARRTSFLEKKKRMIDLMKKYSLGDRWIELILLKIIEDRSYLFLFLKRKDIPRTTNLIEGFNNQLKSRVRRMKGFNSFAGAEAFLNAWMIRRRTLKFVDCRKKFSCLNGKCSLEHALKNKKNLDEIMRNVYRKLF